MKASEMTNEELAKHIECGDAILREAAARLRRPTPVDDDLLKMARDIDKLNAKLKVAEVIERREKEIEATKGEQMTDDMNPRLEDGTSAVPLMAKRVPKKAGQSESVPLAACPFCGSRDIDGTGYAVECNSCGASTRLCASNEEAAESWNARMIPTPMHKTEAGIKDVQDFLYFEAFVVSLRNRISQSDVPGSMVADRDEVALAYATSVWPSRERP